MVVGRLARSALLRWGTGGEGKKERGVCLAGRRLVGCCVLVERVRVVVWGEGASLVCGDGSCYFCVDEWCYQRSDFF